MLLIARPKDICQVANSSPHFLSLVWLMRLYFDSFLLDYAANGLTQDVLNPLNPQDLLLFQDSISHCPLHILEYVPCRSQVDGLVVCLDCAAECMLKIIVCVCSCCMTFSSAMESRCMPSSTWHTWIQAHAVTDCNTQLERGHQAPLHWRRVLRCNCHMHNISVYHAGSRAKTQSFPFFVTGTSEQISSLFACQVVVQTFFVHTFLVHPLLYHLK